MGDPVALELASLQTRHRKLTLIYPHAWMAVIRLSVDPAPPSLITGTRTLIIDHLSSTAPAPIFIQRQVGWETLGVTEADLLRIRHTYNDHEITEKAAIALMALLVDELEKIEILQVLPIGSGGDYAARMRKNGRELQVEVSGIKINDASGSRSRLKQKCEQVLTKARAGFASVTTFQQTHGEGSIAHSFLHYVESSGRRAAIPRSDL